MSELRRHDERCDASGERRRRQATRVFPAVESRQRPLANDVLRRRTHHRRVRIVVETACDPEPPSEQDRKRDLVELGRHPVRRAVESPVLIPASVASLLRLKVPKGAEGRVAVTRIEQRRCDPAQVSRPDKVIDVVAIVVVLAPRRGGGSDESAGVRLVLEAVKQRE